MSAEFCTASGMCHSDFKFATLKWLAPVPGLGPELCHDRGHALPRPGLESRCGTSSPGLCWCDSGTGSHLCCRFGTGIWQVHESTPLAITPINRLQSSSRSSLSRELSYFEVPTTHRATVTGKAPGGPASASASFRVRVTLTRRGL
jgi:hypothetical protein